MRKTPTLRSWRKARRRLETTKTYENAVELQRLERELKEETKAKLTVIVGDT